MKTDTIKEILFQHEIDLQVELPKYLKWFRDHSNHAEFCNAMNNIRMITINKIENKYNIINKCDVCGNDLTLVRPGKYQCDKCI